MPTFDLIISGGSLIGLSLAKALADLPIKIAVIEPRPLNAETVENASQGDSRGIALSYGSRIFLKEIGVWETLEKRCCPIQNIHCSEKGHCGNTHLDAKKQGLPALGYVIPFAELRQCLNESIKGQSNLQLYSPAKLQSIKPADNDSPLSIKIKNDDGKQKTLHTQLLVGADGARSFLRQQCDIKTTEKSYAQAAIIADVQLSIPHKNRAYERFSTEGPMALLPLKNGHCALVYTVPFEELEHTLAMDDAAFMQALQDRFGFRLGYFKWVSARQSFPLSMVYANDLTQPRTLLLGNAAHNLHPIAGQGFNLGLRDVATLVTLITQAAEQGHDIGGDFILQRYCQLRKKDQQLTRNFTDGLVHLFDHDILPLAFGRNLTMLAINMIPPLKGLLTRQATGLSQRQAIQSGLSS